MRIQSLTIFLACLLVISTTSTPELTKKIVEIEPIALDIVLSVYDRAVIFFYNQTWKANITQYEQVIHKFVEDNQHLEWNNTVFGICDMTKDQSGKLDRFGEWPSFQIITKARTYALQIGNMDQIINSQLVQFLKQNMYSSTPLISVSELSDKQDYLILISRTENYPVQSLKVVHKQIFDYLNGFKVPLYINSEAAQSNRIEIYRKGRLASTYAQSAVDALLNFTIGERSKSHQAEVNDLVDFINVETLPLVTYIDRHDESGYLRVFGSSVQYQMLLVTKSQRKQMQHISQVYGEFENAANRNKNEGLKSDRVLFALGSSRQFSQYFTDQLLEGNKEFTILITKTDFSNFQLRKFVYQDSEVTADKLLQFIEDVRMKKLDPKFKSEKAEDNTNRQIRKIVGENFIQEVFSQQEKSVMVLFVDSKDDENGGTLGEALRNFVDKNHGSYQDSMNVGIFDLAKNEHKTLTISTAPELILFERANKKKPKFFKGAHDMETIKNWINYEAKDFTIPENYGEPPIALGGSQQL